MSGEGTSNDRLSSRRFTARRDYNLASLTSFPIVVFFFLIVWSYVLFGLPNPFRQLSAPCLTILCHDILLLCSSPIRVTHSVTVKLQTSIRYLFSYFRLETGSYVLILYFRGSAKKMTLKINRFKAKRNFHTILNFVLFHKYEMYENKHRTKICDYTVHNLPHDLGNITLSQFTAHLIHNATPSEV